jgi:hypothetical protein
MRDDDGCEDVDRAVGTAVKGNSVMPFWDISPLKDHRLS